MPQGEVTNPKFRFDGTVHLGHILIILGFIVSSTIAYSAIRNDLNNHEWRLVSIEASAKEQRVINTDLRDSLSKIGSDIAVIRTQMGRIEGNTSPPEMTLQLANTPRRV